mmetsp:Transcript_1049/g.1483  ORF Transcript_1049/g.1483 Transcript_1049/m.1483 type:complete len:83 (+) Transcript_1049:271-519(+)
MIQVGIIDRVDGALTEAGVVQEIDGVIIVRVVIAGGKLEGVATVEIATGGEGATNAVAVEDRLCLMRADLRHLVRKRHDDAL